MKTLKTYQFFDIRNNLLKQKKFIFPQFSFDDFKDMIEIPNGFISWQTFYVYEKDSKLGNNMQSMLLALAIFDKSTTAILECHFPEKSDAACFLSAFPKLFNIWRD